MTRAPTLPTAEEVEAAAILDRLERELVAVEDQTERLMHHYGLFVSERSVESDVMLRDERVAVERRSRDTASPGTGEFEERVVEVNETATEPVVKKRARDREEVAVRRETAERSETASDTGRRKDRGI